jgi:regulator of replication initiation timing
MNINLSPLRQIVEVLRTKISAQWSQVGVLQTSVYALTNELALVQSQLATALAAEPAQLAEIEAQKIRATDAEAARLLAEQALAEQQATAQAEIGELEQQLESLVQESSPIADPVY